MLRRVSGAFSCGGERRTHDRRCRTVDHSDKCAQGHEPIRGHRCQELELQRRRAVSKAHRFSDLGALVATCGRGRGPERVADDGGGDHAALYAAGEPDMKGLRPPSADDVIAIPVTLDLKTMVVQTSTSEAMPVDAVLEGL